MIYSIEIPKNDFAAITQYLKKGVVLNRELIGRVYTIDTPEFPVTVEVVESEPVCRFDFGGVVKEIRSMICSHDGVTVMLDIDKGYE